MRGAALVLVPLALAACALIAGAQPFAWPTPLPRSTPAPQPTQVWSGQPATGFTLQVAPLGVTPDGEARALVRVVLHDASGAPTTLRRGGDFVFHVDHGTAQWQTRLRYGGPAAIVAVRDAVPVTIHAIGDVPAALGTASALFDTRPFAHRVAAAALGPHLVRIGWFPRPVTGIVRIARVRRDGTLLPLARVSASASSWDDGAVTPGAEAHYVIGLPDGTHRVRVRVPAELPSTGLDVVRGTAAWLSFSGDPLDDERYQQLDVPHIVATAVRAHLRAVELRLAYGAFAETTPAAKPTVDALIDGLTTHGVRVIGWVVPRSLDADDLAEAGDVAAYRTPTGNGISGLAVDLERGPEYLGDGAGGERALRDYLATLRRSVGPHVLLIATVEDPFLDRLTPAAYPYPAIARAADVLQPMVYAHAFSRWSGPAGARAAVAGSIAALHRMTGAVPIDVGVQTAPLGPSGAPTPAEVAAALAESRARGALGVAFYDWSGTNPAQWLVLARAARRDGT
jgi:hypothetical protein